MGRHRKPCQLGSRTNACAWCRLHRITVSPNQLKGRRCLKKQCRHLVPYEKHPIWAQKRAAKEFRAARKERMRGAP